MQLKEGTVVVIRPDLKPGKRYGDVLFTYEMAKYRWKMAKIEEPYYLNNGFAYYINLTDRFIWSEAMFLFPVEMD